MFWQTTLCSLDGKRCSIFTPPISDELDSIESSVFEIYNFPGVWLINVGITIIFESLCSKQFQLMQYCPTFQHCNKIFAISIKLFRPTKQTSNSTTSEIYQWNVSKKQETNWKARFHFIVGETINKQNMSKPFPPTCIQAFYFWQQQVKERLSDNLGWERGIFKMKNKLIPYFWTGCIFGRYTTYSIKKLFTVASFRFPNIFKATPTSKVVTYITYNNWNWGN